MKYFFSFLGRNTPQKVSTTPPKIRLHWATAWAKTMGVFLFFGVLFTLPACRFLQNDTKDKYIERYGNFINRFQEEVAHYTPEQWADAEAQLTDLAYEQYQNFEAEMSYREKLEVNKWRLLFYLTQYRTMVKQHVQVELGSETETLLQSLRQLMDSTYTIYDGYDEDMRRILFKFKHHDDLPVPHSKSIR